MLLGGCPETGKARPSPAAPTLPQLTTVHFHIHFVDQQTEAPRVLQPGKVTQLVNGRIVRIKTQILHYDALIPHVSVSTLSRAGCSLRKTAHKSSLKTEDEDTDLPGPRDG